MPAALLAQRDQLAFRDLMEDEGLPSLPWWAQACAHTRVSPPRSSRTPAEAGVNVEMISTSEIRISIVTRVERLLTRSRLCTPPSASMPRVRQLYAGTGR